MSAYICILKYENESIITKKKKKKRDVRTEEFKYGGGTRQCRV